jgi:pimeloyl-ACP methyl ester carboxylesterase
MPLIADIYYHVYSGDEEGNKPPIVLIHGAGGNHLYWPSEIRRLLGYRVYALDLPGHGKSGGRGLQSITAYAHRVLDWLEAIGLNKPVFVGHSMGSAIALSLAIECPQYVRGLGLIGSGARLRVAPELLESASSPTTFHSAVAAIVNLSFSSKSPPRLAELSARRMFEIRPSVLHRDFLACDAFDETQRIGEIQQPVLILCGEEDKMTPLRSAHFLASSLPKARLEIIPDAGHMVMLEQPKAVADSLLRFLGDLNHL